MSDRIGVMSARGILEQIDSADVLYNERQTAFVADFVGDNNAFDATVSEVINEYAVVETSFGSLKGLNPQQLSSGQSAIAFIRPEAISVVEGSSSLENIVKCTVENLSFEGPFATVFLKTGQNQAFVMRQNNDGSTPFLEIGSEIEVSFGAGNTRLLAFGEVSDA
jgi:spermidine/putrescine transport system ATP-binding protein